MLHTAKIVVNRAFWLLIPCRALWAGARVGRY